MSNAEPKSVDIEAMFKDIFKDMPIEQVKQIMIERIKNVTDYKTLGDVLVSGMKVCALNN